MSPEESFVAELGRVSRRWRARLDELLRHTGLTQARWLALFQVSQHEGTLTQRQLAELLGIEGPTLVRILDGLEKQGLIERCRVAGDRRANSITTTETAKPVINEIKRIATGLRRDLLAGVAPSEIEAAAKVLRSIGDQLE
jgi:MarR family transcriptional regulator for hemolysin